MESDERVAPPLARTSSTGQKQAMSSAVGTPGNSNAIIRSKPAPERHETQKEHVSNPSFCERFLGPVSRADLFYIATWGIFGTIARVYIDRIFGSDCENNGADDFWSASNICITANGRTERKGGALFVDLPANILGSFLMGLFSASAEHPLPWFPRDHHLQQNKSWQKGLTTGFCGCLTTCK